MIALISLVCLAFWGTGLWPGLCALMVAVDIFLFNQASFDSWQVYFVMVSMLLSVPIAAAISTALIERYCGGYKQDCLRVPIILVLIISFLQSDQFYGFLEAAIQITRRLSVADALSLFVAISGAVVFCAAIVALVIMLFLALMELALRWVNDSLGGFVAPPWEGIRMVGAIACVSLMINLLASYFFDSLVPFDLMRQVGL